MRIKLTHNEAQSLLSSFYAIKSAEAEAQAMLARTNAFIEQHREKQLTVEKQIRKRVKSVPKVPLERWDFSQVDQVKFEGAVEVPEPNKEK